MNKTIEQCLFVKGPAGAGKSFISSKISERTGLPYISLDIMRHCPKTIEEINGRKDKLNEELAILRDRYDKTADPKLKESIKRNYNDVKNAIVTCERQAKIRKILPDLPNYEEMGFHEETAKFVVKEAEKYGFPPHIAWHYYQKRFEIQLMEAAIKQIKTPAIIDFGGGMTIALEKDYERFLARARELGVKEADLAKAFPLSPKECLERTLDVMDSIPTTKTVSLQLPQDYKAKEGNRSSRDPLNEIFISTGQYDYGAGIIIDTTGLVVNNKADQKRGDEIANEIITKAHIQTLKK